MTAIQRAVVDDAGNINVHGRSGLEIVWKVKNAEGNFLDISASDLFIEIDTKVRVALTAGEDDYSRKLTLTRTQIATLPKNQPLEYALHDETPSTPATIWSGKITAYGFRNAPAGAAAVDPGTASWTGATVTVLQGESVPTVVVTYMGATGYGMPTGGSAGQLPFKVSSTDHDIAWRNATISDVTGLQAALDGKQAAHANLTAFSGLSLVADGLPYANGTGTLAMATLTAAGRALLDDADAAAQRATLGLVIGTDVQAQSARLQDIATNLSATSGAIEKTGANTFGTYTVTSAGKALLDDVDAAAQRTTLGLGTAAVQNLASMAAMTMAGVLAFVAGTAGAPGAAVAGDLNTGIYGVSADVLGVASGGVQVQSWGVGTSTLTGNLLMGADATYNVGAPAANRPANAYISNSVVIGASSPPADVKLGMIGPFSNEKSSGGYLYSLAWQTNDPAIGFYAADGLLFGTVTSPVGGGWSEKARLTNAGNFGLGVSPSVRFHVSGAGPDIARFDTSGSSVYASWAIANSMFARIGSANTVLGAGAATDLGIRSAGHIYFSTNGSNVRWQIDSSGHFLGIADNTYDFGAGGTARPRNIYAGSGIYCPNFNFTSGGGTVLGSISSAVDGIFTLYNAAGTGFTGIKFGGVTSAQPYLKVNGANLQGRLADDTDFNRFQAKLQTHANAVAETPTATHTLTLYDAAGTAYRVLALV